MNLLLDTQLILWLYGNPGAVSSRAWQLVTDSSNALFFSPVSILEIVIKNLKRCPDFDVDCEKLRLALTSSGVTELPVVTAHTISVANLPPLHKDPFDRLLLAQAIHEGMTLLTTDHILMHYPSHVLDVR